MKWGWYTDGNTARVFLHLLLSANYEPSEYLGHTVGWGQVVFGRKALAEHLKLSEQEIRTAIVHLKLTEEISVKTTNQFSIATITNYSKYQDRPEEPEQPEKG
jgi:hypothetical protein